MGQAFGMASIEENSWRGLCRRVWCEPTERLAYVGPPLRRRTSGAVKPNFLRWLSSSDKLEAYPTLQIDVVGEAGVFHDDAVSLAGVFAEQLMKRGVGFQLAFDVDS